MIFLGDVMGIISDISSLLSIQKMKSGKIAKLSISQIVNMIINLQDAKKNLSKGEYEQICELFTEMRKCTTRMPMNMDLYLEPI